jgi:hypothetical protein
MLADPGAGAGAICLSELRLDRLLAGELDPAARADCERHLTGCPRCTSRRAAREEERRLFRATAPPLFGPSGAAAAAAAAARGPRRWLWLGTGAFAAAAVAVLLLLGHPPRPASETVTAKGVRLLRFYVRDAASGAVREGAPAEVVHPGDGLRFRFEVATLSGGYVALLGRDAAGRAAVYFPERGTTTALLPGTSDGLIPYSIELDQTLGPETIHALSCRGALPLGPLQAALARSEKAVVWPPGCQVETLRLEKTPRR